MNYYAYLRVSSSEQNFDRQLLSIDKYCSENNITNITYYKDKTSGKDLKRKEYQEMRNIIKTGDVLIIKELDRLSRNKEDLKNELNYYKNIGVTVRILNLPSTLQDFIKGQEWVRDMINNILIEVLTTIAEEERIKIRERQREGIEALKRRNGGKGIGRPKRQIPKTFNKYYKMWKAKDITAVEFAKLMQINRSSLYNYIKEYESKNSIEVNY